jgi:hypothetical protein
MIENIIDWCNENRFLLFIAVAALVFGGTHLSHIFDPHARVSLVAKHHGAQPFWSQRLSLGLKYDALVRIFDESGAGHGGGVAGANQYVVYAQVVGQQAVRPYLDLQLANATAEYGDLCHAGRGQQARPNRPVRESPEVHRRALSRGQSDR